MAKFLLMVIFCSVVFAQKNSPAKEVADAERAFSAASEKIGIKESFLQFLADDCVMFNPGPVNGKELYRSRPANPAYLTWQPTFVEAASSGDFGISTGPWEYRQSKSDSVISNGHYFSVWKKQSDGTWKVALDNGISYPKGMERSEAVHVKDLPSGNKDSKGVKNAVWELAEIEKSFIELEKKNEMANVYSAYAAADIRLYHKGNFPCTQKDEAIQFLKNYPAQTDFSPLKIQAASSGDLGYAYGLSVNAKNDTSSYVRVWRKENGWKLALVILESFKQE